LTTGFTCVAWLICFALARKRVENSSYIRPVWLIHADLLRYPGQQPVVNSDMPRGTACRTSLESRIVCRPVPGRR
jgi:hypothetical protein